MSSIALIHDLNRAFEEEAREILAKPAKTPKDWRRLREFWRDFVDLEDRQTGHELRALHAHLGKMSRGELAEFLAQVRGEEPR